jgi:hypothetical protein
MHSELLFRVRDMIMVFNMAGACEPSPCGVVGKPNHEIFIYPLAVVATSTRVTAQGCSLRARLQLIPPVFAPPHVYLSRRYRLRVTCMQDHPAVSA